MMELETLARPAPAMVKPADIPPSPHAAPRKRRKMAWPGHPVLGPGGVNRRGLGIILAVFGMAALWDTDPILLIATLSGIGTLFLIYQGRTAWPKWFTQAGQFWQHLWQAGQNNPFLLAGLAGGGATLGTYSALKVWQDSPSGWVGLGLVLQGIGVIGVLFCLSTLLYHQKSSKTEGQWQDLLTALTAPQALQRYLAIRQLPRYIQTPEQHKILQEALLLLLVTETDPHVKQAGLETLGQLHQALNQHQTQQLQAPSPTAAPLPKIHRLPVRKTESQWV